MHLREVAANRSGAAASQAAEQRLNATEQSEIETVLSNENITEHDEITNVGDVAQQSLVDPADTAVQAARAYKEHKEQEEATDRLVETSSAEEKVRAENEVVELQDALDAVELIKNLKLSNETKQQEWTIRQQLDAQAAHQHLNQLNETITSEEESVESAQDQLDGVIAAHHSKTEAHSSAVESFMDLVKSRVGTEERASDMYQHQMAIVRRAEGLLQNGTAVQAKMPQEVKTATDQLEAAVQAATVAEEHMEAADDAWNGTRTAAQAATAEMAALDVLNAHLKDNIQTSISNQKTAAASFAATVASSFSTASGVVSC